MIDPHTIWAAAQLGPGEGIADGVARIAELLTPDCRTCANFSDPHAHWQCLADLRLADLCMDGDRYQALPPVKLWRTWRTK